MAALDGVKVALVRRLEGQLQAGELPGLAQLRAEFTPRQAEAVALPPRRKTRTAVR